MYDFKDIDVIIFQDLHKNSKLLLTSLFDYIKYFLKRKWKEDYLLKATRTSKRIKKILIMQEPETVCPQSYNVKYHRYFDVILTWNDDLVDNKNIINFNIRKYLQRNYIMFHLRKNGYIRLLPEIKKV